jgi:hypothetical protein
MYFHQLILKRNKLKYKKGGANILLEFIALLPFFFILCLILFDIFKFYYLYNVTSLASYNAAYRFSLSDDIKSSMDSASQSFKLGGITDVEFHSDSVQAWIYQYNKDNKTFNTPLSDNDIMGNIDSAKTNLIGGATIPGLTDGNYNNDIMRNREVWGFKFKIKNNLLSTIPLSAMSAGLIHQSSVDIIVRNHVFEMQYYKQAP